MKYISSFVWDLFEERNTWLKIRTTFYTQILQMSPNQAKILFFSTFELGPLYHTHVSADMRVVRLLSRLGLVVAGDDLAYVGQYADRWWDRSM